MRILYATDGSKAALAGAQLLARLPLTAEGALTIVTVVPEVGGVDVEAILSSARAMLQDTAAPVETRVLRGVAASGILQAELARPTDLIVVGSRGLSTFERSFLGSVAERVARHARSSVLVARPRVSPSPSPAPMTSTSAFSSAATAGITWRASPASRRVRTWARVPAHVSKEFVILPEATNSFEEPGIEEQVARLACDWFRRYLGATLGRP
jgi:nucleotide-binding universal stress UspA family protein